MEATHAFGADTLANTAKDEPASENQSTVCDGIKHAAKFSPMPCYGVFRTADGVTLSVTTPKRCRVPRSS